jgi:hypothetical protein
MGTVKRHTQRYRHAYGHIVMLLYGGIEHFVLWICGGVGMLYVLSLAHSVQS